jgi:anti-anti-sigma factor
MQISMRLDGPAPVLSVEGRLDARGAAEFDETWKALPPDAAHVIVDLTKVEYISSIGVRSLITAEKQLRLRRGRTTLAGLSAFVTTVLKTTGLLGEFQHAKDLGAAMDLALADRAAERAATEHTVHGRRYRITPNSAEPCFLELWGDFEHVSEDPRTALAFLESTLPRSPVDVNLNELGLALGRGGFGSARAQSQDSMGIFVAARKFAGVLPADGHSIPDFVLSERPEDVELAISGAIGFSGPPSFLVEVDTPAHVTLKEMFRDLTSLLPGADASSAPVIGFVAQAQGADGMLIAGLFSAPEKIFAHSIGYEGAPTLNPKLEDLKSVVRVGAETTVQSASISLYLPAKLRLGIEKRLKIEVEGDLPLEEEWSQIIRRLYRDCSRVTLTPLTGGYNARTFRVVSYDLDGRRLLPTVLKIGRLDFIQREEEAHRAYVQRFILNNSTTVMGTATVGAWSALRYNFVGISGPDSKLIWLLDYYRSRPVEDVLALFDRLYTQILKPWYGQPRWEPAQLYADHTPLGLFPDLCRHAERDFGFSSQRDTIACEELGITLPNPFLFLEKEYPRRAAQSRLWYKSITHGDLNLRNVLVDDKGNLYVIDFSETRPRNIVSDFARMESIVKFEMLRVDTPEDVARLVEFEQGLAEAGTMAATPPNGYRGDDPAVAKSYQVICRLREYADTVTLFETDMVPYWLALLEWTFSVLSYDLPPLRRKLAAYSAAILCAKIQALDERGAV